MSVRQIVVDDTDSRIVYLGSGWTQEHGSPVANGPSGPVYENTYHQLGGNGGLSFVFDGYNFNLYGTMQVDLDAMNNTDPSWDCFLDGSRIWGSNSFTPDELNITIANNFALCELPEHHDISIGSHKLTVNVTSNKRPFWLDQISFYPSPDHLLDNDTILIDCKDPAIQYSGEDWVDAQSGVARVTDQPHATMRFNFTGVEISFIGYLDDHRPFNGTYSIDGTPPVAFGSDGSQLAPQWLVVLFKASNLGHGPHSLEVTYTNETPAGELFLQHLLVMNQTGPGNSFVPSAPHHTVASLAQIIAPVSAFALLAGILCLFLLIRARRRRAKAPYPLETPDSPEVMKADSNSHVSFQIIEPYQPAAKASRLSRGFSALQSSTSSPEPLTEDDIVSMSEPLYLDMTGPTRNMIFAGEQVSAPQNLFLQTSWSSQPSVQTSSPTSDPTPTDFDSGDTEDSSFGVIRHRDSGMRLGSEPRNMQVLEVPPKYTPS